MPKTMFCQQEKTNCGTGLEDLKQRQQMKSKLIRDKTTSDAHRKEFHSFQGLHFQCALIMKLYKLH